MTWSDVEELERSRDDMENGKQRAWWDLLVYPSLGDFSGVSGATMSASRPAVLG